VQLLERDAQLALFETVLAAATREKGGCVLVLGEAGIGKTALVHAFANTVQNANVLWGACEALFAPRPLGPIVDMAENLPPGIAARVHEGRSYNGLFPALLAHLRERPSVLVIDDLHWADEATLDCIKYLGRRIEHTPSLLVITARVDELGSGHPLRRVLGDLPARSTCRMELAPLTRAAIDQMARTADRSASELERLSGGNPFYLSELLSAGGDVVPASIRDSVLARVARVSPAARLVLELVAIEPARVERSLVQACLPDKVDAEAAINDVLACGVLDFDADCLAYRHEIARRSVADALAPKRRIDLHALVLHHLQTGSHHEACLSRLVHHARGAGLREQVTTLARRAAERAAHVGSHREAAKLYRLALDNSSGADMPDLLEAAAREMQLVNALEEAIALREQALRLRRQQPQQGENAQRIGVNLRLLGVLHAQLSGRDGASLRYASDAVAMLEPLGPGVELAKAYATLAHAHYLRSEYDAAIGLGERAAAMAEQFDDSAARVLSLTALGAARICRVADAQAQDQVERALALAIECGCEELAADIFISLQTLAFNHHDHRYALDVGERGIAYCEARDLDGAVARLKWRRAHSLLQLGNWEEGEREQADCLQLSNLTAPVRETARFSLHRQASRRGCMPCDLARVSESRSGKGGLDAVDEYWMDVERNLYKLAIEFRVPAIAAACTEAAWLRGDDQAAVEVARTGLAEALRTKNDRLAGPLLVWLQRLGADVPHFDGSLLPMAALELAGDRAGAARTWQARDVPYEQALVLVFGDLEEMHVALTLFEQLGAHRAARIARARLRAAGARVGSACGPRRSTRCDVHGLTQCERKIVNLVAEGLSNQTIAQRLHRSERTVEHHVSAALGKVGARSRTELILKLARRGEVQLAADTAAVRKL
jgi:DNA-binding CsgD family transcriptional regulator